MATAATGSEVNFYLKDGGFEEPPEDIYYLLAANGLFIVAKTVFFRVSVQMFQPVPYKGDLKDFLQGHQQKIELTLPKKIPALLFRQVLSFFREISKRYNCECFLIIYWNEIKNEYELAVPEQVVSPAMVYKAEVGPVPEGMKRLGDIHSHDDMLAFCSDVDFEDEEYDHGLHVIVGEVGGMPSVLCAISAYGERFIVPQKQIFESEEGDNFELPPVPQEWLDRIKIQGMQKRRRM